jgi:hypothetical protein
MGGAARSATAFAALGVVQAQQPSIAETGQKNAPSGRADGA